MSELEKTSKRLEMNQILQEFLKTLDHKEIEQICRLITGKLFLPWEGSFLGIAEKMVIKSIAKTMGTSTSIVIESQKTTGDLGKTAELQMRKKKQTSLFKLQNLTVERIYNSLQNIAKISGEGSTNKKQDVLVGLLAAATPIEARFIVRIVLGDLRIGVADLSLLEALGDTFLTSKEDKKLLLHKFNIHPNIGYIATILQREGKDGLEQIKLKIGIPIRTMAAQRLSNPEEILEKLGDPCAIEAKYDGERVQAHIDSSQVVLFSRNLENITSQYPDVVEALLKQFSMKTIILEGEIVAIDQKTRKFRSFQDLMKRRRKHGVTEAVSQFPVHLYLFDTLLVNSTSFLDAPYQERRKTLESLLQEQKDERIHLANQFIVTNPEEMERKFLATIENGSEGIVAKGLNGIYQPGLRGWGWIKLKRDYKEELVDSFDLVVVGAYAGKGRRAGVYGALLVACYDESEETFPTVSKLGSGFTDNDLKELHEKLEPLKRTNAHSKVHLPKIQIPEFHFEPKFVLEVQAAEVTLSPVHTCGYGQVREDSGLALRFPRFICIRLEKAAEQATTQSEIISIYKAQRK